MSASSSARCLVADVGSTRLGVEVEQVLEIFALPVCARVPHAPPWVRGALLRAGQVVTVVDLAVFLGVDGGPPPLLCVRLDDPELAVAWAVTAVAVLECAAVEGEGEVVEGPAHVIGRVETPAGRVDRLDVGRVLAAIRAAWVP